MPRTCWLKHWVRSILPTATNWKHEACMVSCHSWCILAHSHCHHLITFSVAIIKIVCVCVCVCVRLMKWWNPSRYMIYRTQKIILTSRNISNRCSFFSCAHIQIWFPVQFFPTSTQIINKLNNKLKSALVLFLWCTLVLYSYLTSYIPLALELCIVHSLL